jgi:PAS domain S-box-containing protein
MFQPVPIWKKRKRAQQSLRESEEQWREVFEHNPVMYFMVGPSGTVLSVNGFGAAQLGYPAAELVGQSVLHVFFEEDHEAVKNQLATCLQEPVVRIAGRSAKSARTARCSGFMRMPRPSGGRAMT